MLGKDESVMTEEGQAFLDEQSPEELLGPFGGRLKYIVNERGVSLCCYLYPAAQPAPKGIVMILHGHGR